MVVETELIKYLITGALGIIVWFLKRTVDENATKVDNLKSEIDRIKMDYLLKIDFREFKTELRDMFEEIRKDIHAIRGQHKE